MGIIPETVETDATFQIRSKSNSRFRPISSRDRAGSDKAIAELKIFLIKITKKWYNNIVMNTGRTIFEFLTSLPGRSYEISNKSIQYLKFENSKFVWLQIFKTI